MKKQKTLLIVVLIAAIAMVGLYLAMGLMAGKEEKTGDDAKAVAMLTDVEDVTYIQYTNLEGTVTLTKPELIMLDEYLDEKAAELGKIEGELIADAVKVDCGLEEPAYTLTLKAGDKTIKLFIGVSEDGKYYASIDGKEDIYEIQEQVINILNLAAEDFKEPDGDMSSYYESLEKESEILIEEETAENDDVAAEVITEDAGIEETITEDITEEDTIIEE